MIANAFDDEMQTLLVLPQLPLDALTLSNSDICGDPLG